MGFVQRRLKQHFLKFLRKKNLSSLSFPSSSSFARKRKEEKINYGPFSYSSFPKWELKLFTEEEEEKEEKEEETKLEVQDHSSSPFFLFRQSFASSSMSSQKKEGGEVPFFFPSFENKNFRVTFGFAQNNKKPPSPPASSSSSFEGAFALRASMDVVAAVRIAHARRKAAAIGNCVLVSIATK